MSDDPTPTPIDWPEGPDRVSARRGRRARRLGVVAVLLFTFALWFGESYLRYDLRETQYIQALTLHNESARAVLRNVVAREGEAGSVSPQHLEALAAIEEDDLVLTRYQEAYALNPNSWSLVLEYGTRLFLVNRLQEARERFREAGVQDPENALPKYLEAAALALSQNEENALAEALAIIERTNIAHNPVRFPEPAWHASMPRRGAWYQRKQSDIVDRCCAPLYRFTNLIEARVRAEGKNNPAMWGDWLNTVSAMGRRLVDTAAESAPGQTAQATAGVQIISEMAQLRQWLASDETTSSPQPAHDEAFRNALDAVIAFDQQRNNQIEQMRAILIQPLVRVAETAALLTLCIVTISVLARLAGVRAYGREFAPPPWATWSQALTLVLVYFGALIAYTWLARTAAPQLYVGGLTLGWYGVMILALAAGLVAPVFFVPARAGVALPGQAGATPRKIRWGAYMDLVQRIWEDQLAALIFAGCAWFIFSRMWLGVYPTQLELLVPAFEEEAQAVVSQVAQQMAEPPA